MTNAIFHELTKLFLVTAGPFLPVLALGLAFEVI